MDSSNTLLVVAIDFGTTYSGAAFSFRSELQKDKTKLFAIKIGNSTGSWKCISCILIRPDGKTCHSFGDEADAKYNEDLNAEERQSWYFFKRFKMDLYNLKNTDLSTLKLDGGHGKQLLATTVFSLSIGYLKDKVIESCTMKMSGVELQEDDITWVLTVPAIWDDQAKAFMRHVAEQAGIPGERLFIALEPEAASVFCKEIPIVRDERDRANLVPFQPGTKYSVLDCGGGTVDITVHEVIQEDEKGFRIKELLKARGNDMGGTKVDNAFLDYLKHVFGNELIQTYQEEDPEDFWDLSNEFEEKKRKVKGSESTIVLRTKLLELYGKRTGVTLEERLKEIGQEENVKVQNGKLKISGSVAVSLFKESIDSIVHEVQTIFSTSDVMTTGGRPLILLVGGYSDCHLLQSRIKEEFPDNEVVCPQDANISVLKGAVIFGYNPPIISQRVSKYTYGIELIGGEFGKLVQMNETLVVGEAQHSWRDYYPAWPDDTEIRINVYASTKEDPEEVTDESCKCIETFVLPLPLTSHGGDRKVQVRMLFGETEFILEAKNENSDIKSVHVKRLHQEF